jgi:hypothetical protein
MNFNGSVNRSRIKKCESSGGRKLTEIKKREKRKKVDAIKGTDFSRASRLSNNINNNKGLGED